MNLPKSTNLQWLEMLAAFQDLSRVRQVSPRGKLTYELIGPHVLGPIDLIDNVITLPKRRLNYAFMCAEASWILAGSNQLEFLTRFCEKMAEYSDDGRTLSGAYGPRFKDQFAYVMEKLLTEEQTRQAVMTFWIPNPEPSRDIPCTISLQFLIRDSKLDLYVYMRSSDAWLGVPYDIFSFSMIAWSVIGGLNRWRTSGLVVPGNLWMLTGSRHLYADNAQAARLVVEAGCSELPHVMSPPSDKGMMFTECATLQHWLLNQAILIKNGVMKLP